MIQFKGKYNAAIVYNDEVDEGAIAQITQMINYEAFKGGSIRIMPDVHAGKSCF